MAAHHQKRRLSRQSGSPAELAATATHPIKRVKEEPSSNGEALILSLNPLTISDSDYEDICIPRTQTNHYAASDVESQGKVDDDEPYESDGGLRTLVSCTRQARAGQGKWDADAKHACWNEKYGAMKAEEAVALMHEKWRLAAYDHFEYPKVVSDDDGNLYCRFVCKSDHSVFLNRIIHEDSTSNLLRHICVCSPLDETPEVQTIVSFAAGLTYSKAHFRYGLVVWITHCHHPFSVVEDPELRALMRMLYGRVEIPSRLTVGWDMQLIMQDAKCALTTRLQSLPWKIHLCVDRWTSPNFISFLGVTVHWVTGAMLQNVILDFIKLNKAHTREYLAAKLVKSLKDYAIENKVMAVTCDNTANNRTMVKEMHVLVPEFRSNKMRVRCFGHVLNLVMKAILSQFSAHAANKAKKQNTTDFDHVLKDLGKNSDDEPDFTSSDEDEDEDGGPNADEHDTGNETDEARDAADELELEQLEEEQADIILTAAEVALGKVVLEKVLKLVSEVFCSPHARSELAKLAKGAKLKCKTLIHPVRTHWNTVTCVLGHAIDLSPVLGNLCNMYQFNKDPKRSLRLRHFIIKDEEWTVLKDLHHLLDPFLFATNKMSSNKHALIQDVIPYINILTEHIKQFKADPTVSRVVHAAAARGRIILDRYYSRTDDVAIYRIAMMLHLAFKTAYFQQHHWPQEWIDKALHLIHEEWEDQYRPKVRASTPSADGIPPPIRLCHPGHLSAQRSSLSTSESTRALFEPLSARATEPAKDALEEYLAMPVLESVKDPVAYWDAVLSTSQNDPGSATLAHMALDYLTIPTTSTDAECAFSRGSLIISRLWHSLTDASVHVSALLGSWSTIPDLIPEKETIALLKSHIHKTRAGGGGGDGSLGGLNDNIMKPTAAVAKAGSSHVASKASVSRPSTRPSTSSTRPSTPSIPSGLSKAKKTTPSTPSPSSLKPRVVSHTSSATSLTSDTCSKQDTHALLAASGSKKSRHAVGSGKAHALDNDDIVEILSNSE